MPPSDCLPLTFAERHAILRSKLFVENPLPYLRPRERCRGVTGRPLSEAATPLLAQPGGTSVPWVGLFAQGSGLPQRGRGQKQHALPNVLQNPTSLAHTTPGTRLPAAQDAGGGTGERSRQAQGSRGETEGAPVWLVSCRAKPHTYSHRDCLTGSGGVEDVKCDPITIVSSTLCPTKPPTTPRPHPCLDPRSIDRAIDVDVHVVDPPPSVLNPGRFTWPGWVCFPVAVVAAAGDEE